MEKEFKANKKKMKEKDDPLKLSFSPKTILHSIEEELKSEDTITYKEEEGILSQHRKYFSPASI